MKKINVGLYGGKSILGGKEIPLRAEIIYCDKTDKCSLFINGMCLNVTAPFSCRCKFGDVSVITGYTSRAKKYYTFELQHKSDEMYGKLRHPNNCKIALIDDFVFINVVFTRVALNDNGKHYVTESHFVGGESWIPIKDFNTELIYKICTYRAQAMMGGEITKYKTEQIPEFLFQLKRLIPELYKQFITEYPQFDIKPNHIGKQAYINTLNKDSIIKDCHGNKFRFDGDYLVCENWKLSFVPFDAGVGELRIKITDRMTCEITDNGQVTENTIFE